MRLKRDCMGNHSMVTGWQVGVVNGKIWNLPRRQDLSSKIIRARDSLVKSFKTKKVKTNHAKTRLKDLSKTLPIIISRCCQNFPRPRFFEVPFTTPASVVILVQTLLILGRCCNHNFFDIYTTQNSKVTFFVFMENWSREKSLQKAEDR